MTRILSVDWDFFTPRPWEMNPKDVKEMFPGKDYEALTSTDWSHREDLLYIDSMLWYVRAEALTRNGVDLFGTTGDEVGFWDRFTFAEGAELVCAESHARIADPDFLKGVTELVNFDAHHDAGYRGDDDLERFGHGRWDCASWGVLVRHGYGARMQVVYPRWRRGWQESEGEPTARGVERRTDNGKPVPGAFDKVFICRSGAWVGPWLDEAFAAFVEACPVPNRTYGLFVPRSWDPKGVEQMAQERREHLEAFEAWKEEAKHG